jgi:hypothetical protein
MAISPDKRFVSPYPPALQLRKTQSIPRCEMTT